MISGPFPRTPVILSLTVCLLLLLSSPVCAQETQTRTAFEFSRTLETCDAEGRDQTLEGTTRVVYSWNPNDPTGETSGAQAHGMGRRGAASVNLAGSAPQFEIPETDTQEFALRLAPHTIAPREQPTDSTVYFCEIIKIPDDRTYHVVNFDVWINPDNFANVHHMLLYECPAAEGLEGLADVCPSQFPDGVGPWEGGSNRCEGGNVVYGWAVGGSTQTLPRDVGYPVGQGGVTYVMLEVHYDLPGGIGLTDDSGMVFTVTPTLRPIEAGVFTAGRIVEGETTAPENRSIQIPPGEEAFEVTAWCPGSCLADDINATESGQINLFSVFLHSHLAGREIRVQHARDGIEQPTIINDRNYDFDYQQYQWFFEDQVVLLPGDDVAVTCTYNTADRSNVTTGGLGTMEEMCLVYFMYYPRLPGSLCWSRPAGDSIQTTLCNDGFAVEPIPVITEAFEEPDPCPEAEYPHPAFGDTTPSRIDPAQIEQWRASFEHSLELDRSGAGAYDMYWTTDAANGTVRIGVDVATEGWLGFGFSPNGGMIGSDVIMAWVDDNNNLFFHDRMAEALAEPTIDANQDFFGIRGVQYEQEIVEEDDQGRRDPGSAASIHLSAAVLGSTALLAIAQLL